MSKKTILLADDDKSLVELLGFRLETDGFKVIPAYDGAKALELARKKKPDLIILDIMMPMLNGYEVCMMLKEEEKTKNIPIIMLTAKSQPRDKLDGLKSGAIYYITKPYNSDYLMGKIYTALGLKENVK